MSRWSQDRSRRQTAGKDSPGDARAFYRGIDVRPVDFTAALNAADPLRADPPMHPSYEDRPGAPDRVFASVDDETYEHLVSAWMAALRDAGAERADVLHLHHLTPLNEAARRLAPHVPVLGHIHGTELLMLEAIAAGPPANWRYADAWARTAATVGGGNAAISSSPRHRRSHARAARSESAMSALPSCRMGLIHHSFTHARLIARRCGGACWSSSRADGVQARLLAQSATQRINSLPSRRVR